MGFSIKFSESEPHLTFFKRSAQNARASIARAFPARGSAIAQLTFTMISHAQQLRFIVISGVLLARAAGEISTLTDLDYGDYRGRWCVDDHGYVHVIGQIYYPSPSACPCTCTDDGPVCIQPTCARIHPRCTRIRYKACCPMCESMARVCIYQGRSYRLLEEFRVISSRNCNFYYFSSIDSSLSSWLLYACLLLLSGFLIMRCNLL